MDIRLKSGTYRSITELVWKGIPPFAVITGANGSGKTHLLELIATHAGLPTDEPGMRPRGVPVSRGMPNAPDVECSEQLDGGNTIFLRSDWSPNIQPSNLQQLHEQVNQLWGVRERRGAEGESRYWERVWLHLEESAQTRREQFTRAMLAEHLPANFAMMMNTVGINQNVGLLFVGYLNDIAACMFERGMTVEQAKERLRPLPWDVVNEALEAAALRYRVSEPEMPQWNKLGQVTLHYTLTLQDVQSGQTISPNDLSSGERVLLQVAFWSFGFSQHKGKTSAKLLLLDEPDAHLHPALTSAFLRVIRSELVEKHGVRVIMSTHSPSTLALADQASIFLMTREAPRIRPVESKWEAVECLTAGLVTIGSHTKTVFVEDEADAEFYRTVQQALMQTRDGKEILGASRSMNFIPASLGKQGGGKNNVEKWVQQVESSQIAGIIDLDDGNEGVDRVFVLSRRSLESYLLDPLYIYALLLDEGLDAPSIGGAELTVHDGRRLLLQSDGTLQSVIDVMCAEYKKLLPRTTTDTEYDEVAYLEGPTLKIPRWFTREIDAKQLLQPLKSRFKFRSFDPEYLAGKYQAIELIPMDLIKLLQSIQQGRPSAANPA